MTTPPSNTNGEDEYRHVLLTGTITQLLGLTHMNPDGSYLQGVTAEDVTKLANHIQANYILRSDVAEAVGADEHVQHFSFHGRSDIRDELRREIRAKLGLPPKEEK